MTLIDRMLVRADRMFDMAVALNRDVATQAPGSIDAARELRGAVSRCLLCADARKCAALMETSNQLAQAPGYCRNREFLQGLPSL